MCGSHSHIFSQSPVAAVSIHLPDWVNEWVDWQHPLLTDQDKMALALALAQENVQRKTGGPFASIIVHRQSGLLLSVGVNQVVPQNNSTLHGEVMAIMLGEQRLQQFSLGLADEYELFTSCEPCAMCMGAVLWSGVKRLVCAATGDDARAIGFDEGPVFEASYDYLQQAGIQVQRQVLQPQGQAVLAAYIANGGQLYNGAD
ncbi:nucleoside deaminase [Shewanella dokdonensis]|uniref:Nucleoside deaminase n=1 Tax=Shewanella dokdonensis TaxID=712036 RepID=A0ABX8DCX9_9GAMM|nr:nucleoside deaminase [Shewanella dokdonensis]MCL1073637.1 nucleoside deaminase [Shewanella dokdonensis]QVK22619.1 nucleoside deaminase [Shewanella dokdonensis]